MTPPVTACGGDPDGKGGGVTLTMVAADYGNIEGTNSSQEYWDKLVSAFERRHDELLPAADLL